MITDSQPNTLLGRECALQSILRDIIADYREQLEAVSAHEAFLEYKVETLQTLANELRGARRRPDLDLDEDINF